jgi:hypothetical protein
MAVITKSPNVLIIGSGGYGDPGAGAGAGVKNVVNPSFLKRVMGLLIPGVTLKVCGLRGGVPPNNIGPPMAARQDCCGLQRHHVGVLLGCLVGDDAVFHNLVSEHAAHQDHRADHHHHNNKGGPTIVETNVPKINANPQVIQYTIIFFLCGSNYCHVDQRPVSK